MAAKKAAAAGGAVGFVRLPADVGGLAGWLVSGAVLAGQTVELTLTGRSNCGKAQFSESAIQGIQGLQGQLFFARGVAERLG